MAEWSWFLVGFGVGTLAAALAGWWGVRRHLRKLREAQRRARAAERLAEIGSMTGGLAHEIKNPLSTIGLNAQLVAEGLAELDASEDRKASLSRRIGALSREAERLRGILQDFLQFAGEPRLEPRATDVNELVGELADFFAPECAKRGVRLRLELARTPIVVPLDAAHVKQAVLNLMLNAVQAMDAGAGGVGEGGGGGAAQAKELIVRTGFEAAGRNGRAGVIRVIDTGPGMDAAMRERLFQPYFTTKSGGTGLGLPTARRLIEAHGGRIEVNSEVGRGTEMAVVLPMGA